MDNSFWIHKWEINQIGFHKNDFNQNLVSNFEKLNLPASSHIFVPLAGKTLDIIWLLQKGYKVTAIELSEIAIKTFFEENNLSFKVMNDKGFKKYTSHNLTFIQGDIFNFDFKSLNKIDAIYDRASMVALDKSQRLEFVKILKYLITNGAKLLLVTLEYNEAIFDGPPHSVNEAEVNHHFENIYNINLISKNITQVKPASFKESDEMLEKVYIIDTKNNGI